MEDGKGQAGEGPWAFCPVGASLQPLHPKGTSRSQACTRGPPRPALAWSLRARPSPRVTCQVRRAGVAPSVPCSRCAQARTRPQGRASPGLLIGTTQPSREDEGPASTATRVRCPPTVKEGEDTERCPHRPGNEDVSGNRILTCSGVRFVIKNVKQLNKRAGDTRGKKEGRARGALRQAIDRKQPNGSA